MPFAFTVTVVDPDHILDDNLLTATANLALNQWGQVLAGQGTIDLEIDVGSAGNSSGRGGGASVTAVSVGTDGSRTIAEGGATAELTSGNDPNGATADVRIGIDANYAKTLFLTDSLSNRAPPNLTDGITFVEHEFGHALGIEGYYNASTGVLAAGVESPWDKDLVVGGGKITFNGPSAANLYGGPVPVTADDSAGEAYYHVGVSPNDPVIGRDLMNGLFFVNAAPIDLLDIAIAKDVGDPLTPLGQLELAYGMIERRPQLADIPSADLSAVSNLAASVQSGNMTLAAAAASVAAMAQSTSSVAIMAYQFFTGGAPGAAGMDFLVAPTGPNPNNLNSAYYQTFNVENRYINFAVNLGKIGAGAAAFGNAYGGLSLFDATKQAYGTIFGVTPSDAKVHALLDPTVTLGGTTMTRADYFNAYGQDGLNGIGAKAAMVGWLLAEAVIADVGTYARSNDAFLADVALHSAPFGVDVIGHYNQASFAFNGG